MDINMKVLGIVQARTGSTRFPNKIMYKIGNKTLIELYINRIKESKLLDEIIIATTTNKRDDELYEFLSKLNFNVFRGDENNLIKRYYDCAKEYNGDIIVRLTSDDPFLDPDVIDKAVELAKKGYDFVTNHFEPTYPEGLDVEVYKFSTLKYLMEHAKLDSEKEHVFPYIFNHKDEFNIINFKQEENQSHYRWTIDYECDYEMVKEVYKLLGMRVFKQKELIKLFENNPYLRDINKGIKRKEGVNKSILKDGGKMI